MTSLTKPLRPAEVPKSARHLKKKNRSLDFPLKTAVFFGGVGGIRTLEPLLTATRFPVVLVMTTSILLQLYFLACGCDALSSMNYYNGQFSKSQGLFQIFLSFFETGFFHETGAFLYKTIPPAGEILVTSLHS